MRSLAAKLTIAFLFVGITGAVLVAVLSGQLVQNEFDRFVGDRDRSAVTSALTDYYSEHGSWDGVGGIMRDNGALLFHGTRMTIVDGEEMVVYDIDATQIGEPYVSVGERTTVPLTVDGESVGTALFLETGRRPRDDGGRPDPEALFRRNARLAATISALIAAIISLVFGTALARSLVRPARELTAATQAMATGELGWQVQVRSRDEFGELATSFNSMSVDLARASQMRQQMTADIAHDLRTPLTILRGYTEGLQSGAIDGDTVLYTAMHEEVRHLQHLVEDLRLLSLADAGELRLNLREVDPKALLERTGLAYIHQAQQLGLNLRIDAPDNLPPILIDSERMTQVLNNLVANSLRFTEAGEVVLGAGMADGNVYLQIKDSGAGIAADELPHIFDRFYRADESRQRIEQGGSGLGLAIAKAIVQAHGGRLTVSSEVGQGSTFTIDLTEK